MARNIRELCRVWSTMTYGEGLEHLLQTETDEQLINLSRKLFNELDWYNQPIVGESIEGIRPAYEDDCDENVELSGKICFSPIYREIKGRDEYLPVAYVMDVIREFIKNKKISSKDYLAWIGRAMRTFASLIREEELEYNLNRTFSSWTTESSSDIDLNEHTDIVLTTYDGNVYNIWSYQASWGGLEKLRKKLLGEKDGIIRDGVNILVPVNTKLYGRENSNDFIYMGDNICGWYFTPGEALEDIYNIDDGKYDAYTLSYSDVISRLKKNEEFDIHMMTPLFKEVTPFVKSAS